MTRMEIPFERFFGRYIGEKRLNVGCGANPWDGWVNVDFNPQRDDVVRHDLRVCPWPFERSSFDTVVASHFLEHFRDADLFNIMNEMAQVLKVGGHLIGIVPYALHSDAFSNPYHKQLWDEVTPTHFCRATYERKGTMGTGAHQFMPLADWSVALVQLTPVEALRTLPPPEIDSLRKYGVNVIQEMQFVMRRES